MIKYNSKWVSAIPHEVHLTKIVWLNSSSEKYYVYMSGIETKQISYCETYVQLIKHFVSHSCRKKLCSNKELYRPIDSQRNTYNSVLLDF